MGQSAGELGAVLQRMEALLRLALLRGGPMAPWDAAAYFETVATRTVGSGLNPVQAAPANPRRVALIFCNATAQSSIAVHLGTDTTIAATVLLTPNTPVAYLTQAQLGPIVAAEWWISSGVNNLAVTEIVLRDWPRTGVGG